VPGPRSGGPGGVVDVAGMVGMVDMVVPLTLMTSPRRVNR
jgi:hypothetical protein